MDNDYNFVYWHHRTRQPQPKPSFQRVDFGYMEQYPYI